MIYQDTHSNQYAIYNSDNTHTITCQSHAYNYNIEYTTFLPSYYITITRCVYNYINQCLLNTTTNESSYNSSISLRDALISQVLCRMATGMLIPPDSDPGTASGSTGVGVNSGISSTSGSLSILVTLLRSK